MQEYAKASSGDWGSTACGLDQFGGLASGFVRSARAEIIAILVYSYCHGDAYYLGLYAYIYTMRSSAFTREEETRDQFNSADRPGRRHEP